MATAVYTVEEVLLQDGTSVTLKPLSIKGLRKFMARMEEFGKVEDNDEGMDILLDCAAICLMKERPEIWEKNKNRGSWPADKEGKSEPKEPGGYSEEAEDLFDMPTVYRILDICGGVKLDDPKLLEAVAQQQAAELGRASTS